MPRPPSPAHRGRAERDRLAPYRRENRKSLRGHQHGDVGRRGQLLPHVGLRRSAPHADGRDPRRSVSPEVSPPRQCRPPAADCAHLGWPRSRRTGSPSATPRCTSVTFSQRGREIRPVSWINQSWRRSGGPSRSRTRTLPEHLLTRRAPQESVGTLPPPDIGQASVA